MLGLEAVKMAVTELALPAPQRLTEQGFCFLLAPLVFLAGWGVGGNGAWVWKSFMRGLNPIYMDPLRERDWVSASEADMEGARQAMGDTRRFAERVDLAAMTPRDELSTTRYCLAEPGKAYLVYQPKSGAFTVQLTAGRYQHE